MQQDCDGGAASRARFIFRDGSETLVNSVPTGSTGSIDKFAERVNRFLKEPMSLSN
jgi:hypothetical protein